MNNDDNYNYKSRRQGSTDGTFFAFMTGLALGAVAALLSNPDHREKVRRTFQDVSNKGEKLVADTTKKAEQLADQVGDRAKEISDTVGERAERLAKDAESRAKEVQKAASGRSGNRS
jgi:gas vesicle protein